MNTLQSFAYSAHQHLNEIFQDARFKRSHIHELIAAAFGYKSWAAFRADCFLADKGVGEEPKGQTEVIGRALQLGYPSRMLSELGKEFIAFALKEDIRAFRKEGLYELLKQTATDLDRDTESWEDTDDDFDDYFENTKKIVSPRPLKDIVSPRLLKDLADASLDPQIDYLLARALRCSKPNSYLYEESLRGRKLNSVEQSWVEQYHSDTLCYLAYQFHLRRAALAGVRKAALDYGEEFDNPDFIELAELLSGDVDAMQMARLVPWTERLKWLKVAAEQGSREALHLLVRDEGSYWAMQKLIISGGDYDLYEFAEALLDKDDKLHAWVMQYVALSFGDDLSKDNYWAIGEDGEPYDDDIGGNIFVNGNGGIEFPEISKEQHKIAKNLAKRLLKNIAVHPENL